MDSREELKRQKKEEEKLQRKEERRRKKEERKEERQLKKQGKTNKKRFDEKERYRRVDRMLNCAIFLVSLMLIIVLLFVFFV